MSPRRLVAKANEVVRVAHRLGFNFDHQRGSHAVYRRERDDARVVIPMHAGRDIRPKTLAGILDDMGVTPEEFEGLNRG